MKIENRSVTENSSNSLYQAGREPLTIGWKSYS